MIRALIFLAFATPALASEDIADQYPGVAALFENRSS